MDEPTYILRSLFHTKKGFIDFPSASLVYSIPMENEPYLYSAESIFLSVVRYIFYTVNVFANER